MDDPLVNYSDQIDTSPKKRQNPSRINALEKSGESALFFQYLKQLILTGRTRPRKSTAVDSQII